MEKLKRYPNYKPSGVEWIGEIPEHWVVKPLKYLATCNDEVLAESTDPDTVIEYIEISDVAAGLGITGSTEMCFKDAPSRARRVVRQGDILVSTVRTYLKAVSQVKWNIKNLVASTGFAVLRSNKVKSDLLGYVVTSRFIDEVTRRSTGVSYPAISSTELMNIAIPYAPSNEQETISSYLDEKTALIDETIAKKERLIQLLQEERTALINKAVTHGLDDSVPLKDSGVEWLGMIPEHWEVKRLKFAATPRPSNIDKKSIEGQRVVYLCNYTDVYKNEFITEKLSYMKATATEEQINKFKLEKGDVIVTKDSEDPQDIAIPAVVKEDLDGVVCGYHLTHIKVDRKQLNGFYLFRLFQGFQFNQQFTVLANGVTRYGLSTAAFSDAYILIPPLVEQNKIVKYLDDKTALIDKAVSKERRLIELLMEERTALINEVVTGKRCVF